jgi:futalosine hydrolase
MEGALLRPHVPVIATGVGAVNAASALTQFLERDGARRVIVCGIGGAYPKSNLRIGDAVWASSECYGDLGVLTPSGFLDMQAMGFPLIAGAENVYNSLPLDIVPSSGAVPFATVNTCTGEDAAAAAMAQRTGAAVENMEGAAIAHVARLYGIPCGEVRGISNLTGNRDRAAWKVKEAAAAAQEALIAYLGTERTWVSAND